MFYGIQDDITGNNLKNWKRKNKDGKDNYATEIMAEQMELLDTPLLFFHGAFRRIQTDSGALGEPRGRN